MIDLDSPFPLYVHWYQCWRGHIRKAKEQPESAEIYSRSAVIAQAMYVIYLAFHLAELHKEMRG